VSLADATPQRSRTTTQRQTGEPPAIPVGIVDELVQTTSRQHYPNLGRGIVWADILADIAADEEERQLRAGGQLRDAA